MAVLVTGGAGYIGSHTCVELLENGEELIIADNFINSKPEALSRIREITGKDFRFYEADLLDREAMERIFAPALNGWAGCSKGIQRQSRRRTPAANSSPASPK